MTIIKDKVLLVDDEPNVLSGYKRGLRGRFDVFTAEGGEKGLEILENSGPFSVVVADMRMPSMDGIQFLKRVKRQWSDTVRMMLTGNADQETAKKAVNQGSIFRFLTKPCPSTELVAALALGIRQYKLVTAEKEVLEKTLAGSVRVMTELLSASEPEIVSKSEKVCDYLRQVVPGLEIDSVWELEMAAMLGPLGVLTLPPEVRNNARENAPPSDEETRVLQSVPGISSRLISRIPRLEAVAALIEHGMCVGGGNMNDCVPLEQQNLELRLLRVLTRLVEMEAAGVSVKDALKTLCASPHQYDVVLIGQISEVLEKRSVVGEGIENVTVMEVRAKELLIGDVLSQNVESLDDRLLLSKGTVITEVYLARLHNYRRLVGIQEPVRVYRKAVVLHR